MSRYIDGDALKIARAEKTGPPPVWKFAGDAFVLPAELPWVVVEAFAEDTPQSFVRAVKAMLGDEQYEKAVEAGATRDDFGNLLALAQSDSYGIDPEEASSSSLSSESPSGSSNPTSSESTDSTSETACGETNDADSVASSP